MTAISINHVSIHSQDLERSAAFYEQLFGMERIPTLRTIPRLARSHFVENGQRLRAAARSHMGRWRC